ncbi:MAG: nucleotidyl transferase AbiEii/AbiGii toxin family protein [Spirochaetales bacterium]|nr:nucleotidyl transferase AbiEii/AbiGii toxin family protein [Spirochaetales bacterium]
MKNISASIRAKLLNMAKKEHIPFQRILTLYKQEGILHRIMMTQYSKEVVLKGGLLFYQLQGFIARPTKDIDLLGLDRSSSETILQEILTEACTIDIEDGLRFDSSSIEVRPITGQTEHGGVRAWITAYLDNARTRLQIDMGFGDVITGGPVNRPYRTLLGNRSFSIQTYSDETVAAEKLEALVSRGTVNSRFKDLYDLYELLIVAELTDDSVITAACNTFNNRNTALPELPKSLTELYWSSTSFEADWNRYLKRIEATGPDRVQLIKVLLPKIQSIYKLVRARCS